MLNKQVHEFKFYLLLVKATKWFRILSAINKEWFSPRHKKKSETGTLRKSVKPVDGQGIKQALRRSNHRRKPEWIICNFKNRLVEVSALEVFFMKYVWKTVLNCLEVSVEKVQNNKMNSIKVSKTSARSSDGMKERNGCMIMSEE